VVRPAWIVWLALVASPAALNAQAAAPASFDPTAVGLYSDSFTTLIEGIPRGWHTYALSADRLGFHYVEAYDLPGFGHRVIEVLLTPRLEVLRATAHGHEMKDSSGADIRYAGRRATGWAIVRRAGRAARAQVDTVLPPGAFDGLALMALIPALHLAPDTSIALTLFDTDENSITTQTLHVGSVEQVNVPAGRFSAFRVSLSTTQTPVLLWYTTSTPHTLVQSGASGIQFYDVLVSHRSLSRGR
jgi:hypothetical protein